MCFNYKVTTPMKEVKSDFKNGGLFLVMISCSAKTEQNKTKPNPNYTQTLDSLHRVFK